MVAFQGNLADIGLASVLQNLRDARKTGTLSLKKGDEEKWFHLDSGRPSMVSRGEGWNPPLVEVLARTKAEERNKLRAFAGRRRTRPVHEDLLRSNLATEDEIAAALRGCIEEEFYQVFTWEAGSFEFHEGSPPEGMFDPVFGAFIVSVEPQSVMLEAARRADELVRIRREVRGEGDLFVPVRPSHEIEEAWIAQVASFVNGKRTVKTIAAEAGMEGFHVQNALAWLAESGYIKRATGREVIELAPSLEPDEAISALKAAAEPERGEPELRAVLAEALARSGRTEEASVEYKLAASALAEREKLDRALELIGKAADLSKKDIAAREKLLELADRAGRKDLIAGTSVELARLYRRAGLAEKAVFMMEKLQELRERDADSELELAEGLLAAGKEDEAAKGLARAAESFAERGDDRAAGSVLERLVRLRPGDRSAKRKLDLIRSGTYRRARKRELRVRLAVYGGLALFYLALLFARELLASRELERATYDALRMISCGVLYDTRRRATQAFAFARERCEDVAHIFGQEALFPPARASLGARRLARRFGRLEAEALLFRGRRQETLARSASTERQRTRLLFLARETYLELARLEAGPEPLKREGTRRAKELARVLAAALGGEGS